MTISKAELPKIGMVVTWAQPELLSDAAALAEALGYESMWTGEHVVLPVSFNEDAYPGEKLLFGSQSIFLEPLVALAYASALTSTLRFGTNIVIAPLRDPFLTARGVATIDVLSRGRFELGVGLGWSPEEFQIMGHDFASRGRRTNEFLQVLSGLFSEPTFEFHGEFFDFPPVAFAPKPTQRPRPPILVGGNSDSALRRAARYGDGWMPGTSVGMDKLPERLAFLEEERRRAGREHSPFEITLTSIRAVAREELEAARALGVHRWLVSPWDSGGEDQLAIGEATSLEPIRDYASTIGLASA